MPARLRLTKDQIYERWRERFPAILTELHYLFSTRRKFRDIQTMFTENERLGQIGSQAWDWILGIWGRDAVIAVRRELDDDSNTISLGTLLDEMAEHPDVLTRRRHLANMTGVDKDILAHLDGHFDSYDLTRSATDRLNDHLTAAGIEADRAGLDRIASPVMTYANRLVAHRTPVDKLDLTIGDINRAIDAMEPVVQKYNSILTGNSLDRIEPVVVGDDWREVFTFPWHIRS